MDSKPCIICNQQFSNFKVLLDHATTQHCLNPEQYFIQQDFNGVKPTCKCGCGQPTTFSRNTRSFGEYLRGHISRIKNNWGNNEQALQKSHQSMREKRAQGECPAWNKGLLKETDERVAAYGKSGSETIRSDQDELRKRSERMTRLRLNRTVPSLFGPDHPQWKGGTSSLSAACHSDNRLYMKWKRPKLESAGWKCTECGNKKDLCIHHDKEEMAPIIHRFVTQFAFDMSVSDNDLKRQVIDAIVDYHLEHNVSGVVLCYGCHAKRHPKLNFGASDGA